MEWVGSQVIMDEQGGPIEQVIKSGMQKGSVRHIISVTKKFHNSLAKYICNNRDTK